MPENEDGADRLIDVVGQLWTAERTQEALGHLSDASMRTRREAGTLLAISTAEGDMFYPVDQFETRDGVVQVKPGLQEFMQLLRERDPWTVAVLLHTPADELGGRSPLEWVQRSGDPSALLAYATAVSQEFSR